jgi:hypothetical protein
MGIARVSPRSVIATNSGRTMTTQHRAAASTARIRAMICNILAHLIVICKTSFFDSCAFRTGTPHQMDFLTICTFPLGVQALSRSPGPKADLKAHVQYPKAAGKRYHYTPWVVTSDKRKRQRFAGIVFSGLFKAFGFCYNSFEG